MCDGDADTEGCGVMVGRNDTLGWLLGAEDLPGVEDGAIDSVGLSEGLWVTETDAPKVLLIALELCSNDDSQG